MWLVRKIRSILSSNQIQDETNLYKATRVSWASSCLLVLTIRSHLSLLIVSFLPIDSCVYDTHSKCAPWINTVWFVCMQQGDGTFQARGTGVYEDLPCGLVRDCKIRRLREVSPFLRSRVVWVKKLTKENWCERAVWNSGNEVHLLFARLTSRVPRGAQSSVFFPLFFFHWRDGRCLRETAIVIIPVSGELLLILRWNELTPLCFSFSFGLFFWLLLAK